MSGRGGLEHGFRGRIGVRTGLWAHQGNRLGLLAGSRCWEAGRAETG